VVQLRVGALEQLVARVGHQHVGQGLAVMAGRGEAGAGDDPLDLLAQQRDRPRTAVIGGRGEMADEGMLADHLALGIVALDPDPVEVGGPVDGRSAVRLDDQQGRGILDRRIHLGRPVGKVAVGVAQDGIVRIPHQPQPGAFDHIGARLAPAADPVFAVAEKGKVVLGQPFEKFCHFGRDIRRLLRRLLAQRRRYLGQLGQDRFPILDRNPHIRQHLAQFRFQRGQCIVVTDLIDLRLYHRLAQGALGAGIEQPRTLAFGIAANCQNRMQKRVDADAALGQEGGQRIDQKRHVIVDDLQHAVRRFPAVFGHARIVQPQARRTGLAVCPELPQGQGGAIELLGLGIDHLVRRYIGIELPQRLGKDCSLGLAEPRRADLADRRQLRIQTLRFTVPHRYSPT
jgi:hypothetical protein